MALRHEPFNVGNRPSSRTSKKESAFRTHLAVYLCVGLFLFTLNLLTSPFQLWFYWPMFFWGWCLVLHAVVTFGTDAPARVLDDLRSLVPWVGDAIPASPSDAHRAADAAPFAAEAFAAVHERIERLTEIAWNIADTDVRGRAEQFCAEAEQIVASMARDRADADTVDRFNAGALDPAESMLEQYVDAEERGSANSDEAARRIAERHLPLVLSRIDAYTDASHRGEGADPLVADEPLSVDPSGPHGAPLRSHP